MSRLGLTGSSLQHNHRDIGSTIKRKCSTNEWCLTIILQSRARTNAKLSETSCNQSCWREDSPPLQKRLLPVCLYVNLTRRVVFGKYHTSHTRAQLVKRRKTYIPNPSTLEFQNAFPNVGSYCGKKTVHKR